MTDLATDAKPQPRPPLLSSAAYDLLCRAPAVAFFGFCAFVYGRNVLAGVPGLIDLDAASILQLLARTASFLFVVFVLVALATRLPPIAKRGGVLPRLVAMGGTFALLGMAPLFPLVEMPLGMAALSFGLLIAGNGFSCYALLHLGRALSIMPEARRLVTTGPYRLLRHPLYAAEALASLGLLLQYLSLGAVALWAVHISLQVTRMFYEEQVLRRTFPEYKAYMQRTPRLLPGVF